MAQSTQVWQGWPRLPRADRSGPAGPERGVRITTHHLLHPYGVGEPAPAGEVAR